ncbi:RecB family exonuclease [Gottschalkia purinilytica]|uniref:RecB family exonuclease n=1 Tax=Gottschalkia purinilytica TaxID=1503 RepID=A0A0L0W9J1_GOTPU|nr:RecB family exonuclease [Gottschalkia purinilytica]
MVELKKSDADLNSTKWQVLLYLKKLKEKGIIRKGKIEVIEKKKQDKKIHYVELTQEYEEELDKLLLDIEKFLSSEKPPIAERSSKCKKCAYYEYCNI